MDVYFTVKNWHGTLIPHLAQQNCSVRDDKVPQTFNSFVTMTDKPLTLGILLDTSASQSRLLPVERDATGEFFQRVLRSEDQAFLVSFDVNLNLLQDYTNSPNLLMHALGQAHINDGGSPRIADTGGRPSDRLPNNRPNIDPGPFPQRSRSTLFYDAIYEAANEMMNQEVGRKALIVLTDADDEGSSMTSGDAVAAAERNNVPVYVIMMGEVNSCTLAPVSPLTRPSAPPASPGPHFVDEPASECGDTAQYFMADCPACIVARCISKRTGGRFIELCNDWKKLGAAFQQIEDELRSQYSASYTPSDAKADGSFHKIAIQCHGDDGQDLRVQVREGYYARSPAK